MPESDFLGRLSAFFDRAGVLGVTVVVLLLLLLAALAVLKKRTALVAICLFALVFSGAAPTVGIGEGATLLRWVVMGLMALTVFQGIRSPGLPLWLIAAMAAYGLVAAPASPSWKWAVQVSIMLFIMAVPFGGALADHLRALKDVEKLLKTYLLAAGLLAFMGIIALPELVQSGGGRYARFSGTGSSSEYVLQGGLSMPICLWGTMYARTRSWKMYCFVVGVAVVMLCLMSGTRTGTFAGLLGCIPLLFRIGAKRLLIAAGFFGIALVVFFVVLSYMPERAAQLYERYVGRIGTGLYTSGRIERWTTGWALCLEGPWLGHGVGSSFLVGFGMHNAYLRAWYELGLFGLLAFVGAFVLMAVESMRLIFRSSDMMISDLGRMLLGILIVLASAGFLEGKLLSPTNVSIVSTVLLSVMLTRVSALAHEKSEAMRFPEELPRRESAHPADELSGEQV